LSNSLFGSTLGEFPNSYAYDGKKGLKISNKTETIYGEQWSIG